jgi:hypothetical protein
MKISSYLICFSFITGVASAATVVSFDGGPDSTYSLQGFGVEAGVPTAPPNAEPSGGNPGGFLQLTQNINSEHNFVPFDRTDAGTFPVSVFSFDFRIDNLSTNGGADGFSFSYLDTSTYNTSGPLGGQPFSVAEDPAAFGVLGFGFDSWGSGAPNDANANQANYSEISIFLDGGIPIARVDDTRLLATPLNIKDGLWHRVNGSVDFQRAVASLNVDGKPIFTNTSVPGLAPYESRILFAGRTGGANERTSIDNINVTYGNVIPEPGSVALLTLGGLTALRRRRS